MANERLPDSAHGSLPHDARPGASAGAADLPYATERAEIEAAANDARTRAGFPAEYVDRVGQQSSRFALRTAAPGDIRAAIALLEEQTNISAVAPTDSRYRGVDAAKKVVRKAVFFAVNHLTEQMRALGWATTSVGTTPAERIEQLESRVHELEARLARLDPDDSTRS